jgi:hypothetical protein
MNKIIVIILGVVLFISVAGGGIYFYSQQNIAKKDDKASVATSSSSSKINVEARDPKKIIVNEKEGGLKDYTFLVSNSPRSKDEISQGAKDYWLKGYTTTVSTSEKVQGLYSVVEQSVSVYKEGSDLSLQLNDAKSEVKKAVPTAQELPCDVGEKCIGFIIEPEKPVFIMAIKENVFITNTQSGTKTDFDVLEKLGKEQFAKI